MEKEFDFSNIVYVPVRCDDCGKEGSVPTLKQILEKEGTPLREMLDRDGYVSITCGCKHEEATE